MQLSLQPLTDDTHPLALPLNDWYASHPRVRRLWAVTEAAASSSASRRTRVILMLSPTPDGDETIPVWLANCHAWAGELSECVGHDVELELLEPGVPEDLEVDGDGQMVVVQSWRDS